jgi:hypothetical protein
MPLNEVVTDYDASGFPQLARATLPVSWNGIGLAAPPAPGTSTATSGGTVADGTYQVVITLVNAAGESIASASASQVTSGGNTSTLTVTSPAASGGATGWYAYVTQAGGSTYTRQQAAGSPTAMASNLTLTAPPTSTGAAPPTVNTTGGILRATAGRLARVSITTSLAGSGGKLAFYDSATGQPGDPLLVIPVASGSAGQVLTADMPAASGITVLGSLLTAGAVTAGYS